MSAEPEEVEKFFRQGAPLAAKMIGSSAGALIGAMVAGPPGAIIGSLLSPVFEHHINRAVGEIITRNLGERQRVRAAAGTVLMSATIDNRLQLGQTLRGDNFDQADETGRKPFDELTEQAVLDMMNSVEERRLPYLANFYASLYFDTQIPRASIATFVSIASSLNFRAMCILSIVGQNLIYTGSERVDGQPSHWPDLDHMIAKEAFNLIASGVLVNKADDSNSFAATLGYTDIEPGTLRLGPIGKMIYEKMALSLMQMDAPDLIETKECLQRIGQSPSGDLNFAEQYEKIMKPYELVFDLSNWSPSGDEFVIKIPIADHRNAGSPVVQVEKLNEDRSYSQVGLGVQTTIDGTVELQARLPFAGRAVVS